VQYLSKALNVHGGGDRSASMSSRVGRFVNTGGEDVSAVERRFEGEDMRAFLGRRSSSCAAMLGSGLRSE